MTMVIASSTSRLRQGMGQWSNDHPKSQCTCRVIESTVIKQNKYIEYIVNIIVPHIKDSIIDTVLASGYFLVYHDMAAYTAPNHGNM